MDESKLTELSWTEAFSLFRETIYGWVEAALRGMPNFILGLLIVVVFWIGATVSSRMFEKVFQRAFDSDVILRLASTVIKSVVICIGFFIALGVLGLQKAALSMLAGAGVIGIALGFAFQDAAENLIAGIVMGIRKPFRKGDLVETHDQLGFVRKLNLRNTILENFSGQQVIIPNKEVFQNTLVNYQTMGKRRVEFEVGVAYDTKLKEAIEVGEKALKEGLDFILNDEFEVLAYRFGESSVDLKVRYWIRMPGEIGFYEARHRGVMAIHEAFNDAGIVIPFPIRTLEFGDSRTELVDEIVERQRELVSTGAKEEDGERE